MSEHHQKVALRRFTVVSAVLSRLETGLSFSAVLREVTRSPPLAEDGCKIRCSERTLRRWVESYRRHGFDGLLPEDRQLKAPSRVLESDFISYIRREKTIDQDASIPELMRRAKEDRVDIGSRSRVTVWRAAKKLNLPIFSAKTPESRDKRRFAWQHPLQMVLTDGVHFRAGPKRAKRVAMILLDDATRFALAGVVGCSENSELFLQLIWQGLCRHGLFSSIYVDHGSGFSSGASALIMARLGIALVHGTVGYPEGRGKIERFHRTLREQLLRGFSGSGDPGTAHLQLQLNHYLEHIYNQSPHTALDGATPARKFLDLRLKDERVVDYNSLREHFLVSLKRKASRTNDAKLDGILYELPKGYSGKTITIIKDILTDQYFFDHDAKRIQIFPVDQWHNAMTGRDRLPKNAENEDTTGPVETAAGKHFRRIYRPIVSSSGDYYEKDPL